MERTGQKILQYHSAQFETSISVFIFLTMGTKKQLAWAGNWCVLGGIIQPHKTGWYPPPRHLKENLVVNQ